MQWRGTDKGRAQGRRRLRQNFVDYVISIQSRSETPGPSHRVPRLGRVAKTELGEDSAISTQGAIPEDTSLEIQMAESYPTRLDM